MLLVEWKKHLWYKKQSNNNFNFFLRYFWNKPIFGRGNRFQIQIMHWNIKLKHTNSICIVYIMFCMYWWCTNRFLSIALFISWLNKPFVGVEENRWEGITEERWVVLFFALRRQIGSMYTRSFYLLLMVNIEMCLSVSITVKVLGSFTFEANNEATGEK